LCNQIFSIDPVEVTSWTNVHSLHIDKSKVCLFGDMIFLTGTKRWGELDQVLSAIE